ncbi:MAG: 4Fe-4S binding protein [Candidatus Syntrophosphaera sp.]|nr:4Fe-4S binding protein [Candidatus Syntrophosphaera sp.]
MKADTTQRWRRIVQILSFSLAGGFLALVVAGGSYVIHQACPYAVVCFGLSGSNFLNLGRLAMAGAIIFGFAVLVHSMFYGRRFCAWLCPLGSLQEWIFSLRGQKYRMQHRAPFYVDRRLAFLKYLVLAVTVVLTVIGLGYIFIRLCPFYSLSMLPRLAIPGLAVLGIIVLQSFFGERQWCRFLCPYAALLNVFQWIGELIGIRRKKIRRNLERCTDCGMCSLNCPMNIDICASEYVHDRNCIHCWICAQKCPKQGTCNEECECEE